MKIGIFGGAFNPPHLGHIDLASKCIDFLNLDKLLIIPSGISPHKSNVELIDNKYRVEMCRLAFNNIDKCVVSEIETKCDGVSYSYITIEKLKKQFSDDELILICGSDMYLSLLEWKNPQYIFDNVKICGFVRNNENINSMNKQKNILSKYGADSIIANFEIVPYSSTIVRNSIKKGSPFQKYISKEIFEYIIDNNLYKD